MLLALLVIAWVLFSVVLVVKRARALRRGHDSERLTPRQKRALAEHIGNTNRRHLRLVAPEKKPCAA